ncbi:MAG: hypothetical protein QM771_02370 [Nitrospira sp.]
MPIGLHVGESMRSLRTRIRAHRWKGCAPRCIRSEARERAGKPQAQEPLSAPADRAALEEAIAGLELLGGTVDGKKICIVRAGDRTAADA